MMESSKQQDTVVMIGDAGGVFDMAVARLRKEGFDAVVIGRGQADSFEACRNISAEIRRNNGPIRMLAISALIGCDEDNVDLADMSVEGWKKWKHDAIGFLYDINRSFVRQMIMDGGGRILIVGSLTGVVPACGMLLSGAASAAAFMIAQSMAVEFAEQGITTNALALGVMEDSAGTATPANTDILCKFIPARQPVTVQDAVGAVLDLLTAGSSITGSLVKIDAGISCSFMREW